MDPGDLFSTPRLDPVNLRSDQIGISSHWINTVSRRNEMRRKRNIHQVILYCLFIIGVFQLHYKILWYLWSMHAQKIKFSFVIWSLLFGFHKPALQKMSLAFMFCLCFCDNIILLENWCFFRLSSHLHAYLYACMYCTHNLQTVKLEILLRLEIGKQNMQVQDFYFRNHFGHHGR